MNDKEKGAVLYKMLIENWAKLRLNEDSLDEYISRRYPDIKKDDKIDEMLWELDNAIYSIRTALVGYNIQK